MTLSHGLAISNTSQSASRNSNGGTAKGMGMSVVSMARLWGYAQMNRCVSKQGLLEAVQLPSSLIYQSKIIVLGRLNDLFSLSRLCSLKMAQTAVSEITLP